jgi:CRISPR-associated protein Csm4
MTVIAWKLTPRTGMHLGREGLEQETSAESFPSDSLFAALIAQLAQLSGAQVVEEVLAAFEAEVLPFRLSSLFPIAGAVPLLPRPMIIAPSAQRPAERAPGDRKKARKIAWVSPTIFSGMLHGTPLEELARQGHTLQQGRVLIAETEANGLPDGLRKKPPSAWNDEDNRLWDTGTVPRVTIDRLTSESSIYRVGRTVFAEGCGLWLLAEVREDYTDLLETLLIHLSDTGIGGERSAGYGVFSLGRITPPVLNSATGAQRVVTLSRVNPRPDELEAGLLHESAYELIDVGGWLNAPGVAAQRRQRIRMIESGAVLNTRGIADLRGQLVDVRPEYALPGAPPHPVIRSGIALAAGV